MYPTSGRMAQLFAQMMAGAKPANRYGGEEMRGWLDQESQFQDWAQRLPWYTQFTQNYGEPPDLNTTDYDYRRAWQQGIQPTMYIDGKYHWPSIDTQGQPLKSPTHKTWWKEIYMRETGQNPDEVGITEPPDWIRNRTQGQR